MDIRFDPFLSGKESQRTLARCAIKGHLWLTLNTHVCHFSLKRLSGWIPLLGWLTSAGLGLLLSALWWVTIILWVWLIIMAFVKEDYHLPFVSEFVRYWV